VRFGYDQASQDRAGARHAPRRWCDVDTHILSRRQRIDLPLDQVFAFFADPANLDRLTPPWLHFRMLTPPPIEMRIGLRIEYRIRWRGWPVRWLTEIEDWTPGRRFVDRQLRGPYRLWHHTHTFSSVGGATQMDDVVRYALPAGALGRFAHALLIRRDLERIFDFRARQISALLDANVGCGAVAANPTGGHST
jgi:ligand-binding SRPBCC domain-containing protein